MRSSSLLFLLAALPLGGSEIPDALPIEKIVERLVAADDARAAGLHHYTGQRRYVLVNERFSKRAELMANVEYKKPGDKRFEIVSESGSGIIRSRVLRKMLEAETDASQAANRKRTRVLPENYDMRLLGTGATEGRTCYLVQLEPRSQNKYLIRGKAWIDARDFAVIRVEGSPAQSPSFWIKDTKIVQRYAKTGAFWLPVSNVSTTDARVFGKTDVTIDYLDYHLD